MPTKKTEENKKKSSTPKDKSEEKKAESKKDKTTRAEEEIDQIKEKIEDNTNQTGPNLGNIFLGLVLILFGIAFLAKNLGWINIDLGFHLLNLWPLLIVFLGLSIMKMRGWMAVIVSTIVALVTVGVLGIIFIFNGGFLVGDVETTSIEFEKDEGANYSRINIKTGAGEIKIKDGAGKLLEGKLESNFLELEKNSKLNGEVQEIDLKTDGKWSAWLGGSKNLLDLKLNQETPTEIYLDVGAANINLDLRNIPVNLIDIDTGASNLDIQLGNKIDKMKVRIDAGISSVKITLPEDVGAVLKLDSGLTSKDLKNFDKKDGQWISKNYKESEKIIELEMDLGVSSLEIDWE